MCGIYGVLTFSGVPAGPEDLARMGRVTVHRGPDDEGYHVDRNLAFGMRRLSIIDIDGGHQPISNEDRSVWCVCNGEIYNFRELRRSLQKSGHQFRTRSDSEVLVHLYEEHGLNLVDHIEGMFGFAIWDAKKERLVVGRDHVGIKPVYYEVTSRGLRFASEAKAILALGDGAVLDADALAMYMQLGYVPAPLSIFKGIRKLQPGSLLVCEKGNYSTRRYWKPGQAQTEARSNDDWAELIQNGLRQAVRSQMVSDVPLGAFLSGGIDSSSVVAVMAQESDLPVNTYAIGFDGAAADRYYSELPYARRVSNLFGTRHREILVRPDINRILPELLWHMDEPIADSAFITTYLVSKFAREDVKVILSGVGGDELFGGYRRYLGSYYSELYGRLPAALRSRILKPLAEHLPSDRHSPVGNGLRLVKAFIRAASLDPEARYQAYVDVMDRQQIQALTGSLPDPQHDPVSRAFREARCSDSINVLLEVDFASQLPDDLLMLTDKMSMATSLECRVPLLDKALVDLSFAIPGEQKIQGRSLKHLLKAAMGGTLPKEILERPKRGFGAPMGAWIKSELSEMVDQVLSPASIAHRGLFDPGVVQGMIDSHKASREDRTDQIQALVNFELWAKMYLDGMSFEDLSDSLIDTVRS